jgi:hypothetical protein
VNYNVRTILAFSDPELFAKSKQDFLDFLEVRERMIKEAKEERLRQFSKNIENARIQGYSEKTIMKLEKELAQKKRYYESRFSNIDELRSCLHSFEAIFIEKDENKAAISGIEFQIEQAKKNNPNDENIIVLQKILAADLERMVNDRQKRYDAVRERFIRAVKKQGIAREGDAYQNLQRIIGYYQHKVLAVTDSKFVENKDTKYEFEKRDETEKLAIIEKYFHLISKNKGTEVKRTTFITKLGFKPNKMKTSGKIYIEKLAQVNVQLFQLQEAVHLIQKLNEGKSKSTMKFVLFYEELKNIIEELQREKYLLNREIENSDYSKIEEKVKLNDEKEEIRSEYFWLAYRYHDQKNQKNPDQAIIAQLSKEMDSIKLTEKEKEETSLNAKQLYRDRLLEENAALIRERETDEKVTRFRKLAYLAERLYHGKEKRTPEFNYATVAKEMNSIDLPPLVKDRLIQEAKNKINDELYVGNYSFEPVTNRTR